MRSGYSGLPKWMWFMVPVTIWNWSIIITSGAPDLRGGGWINFGSSTGGAGFGAVFTVFIVHDWWLMWRDWRLARAKKSWLNQEAMKRNPSHPDWVRAYQRKSR